MAAMSREEAFAEFAWQATQAIGLVETVTRIVQFARRAVNADAAGITMIRAGGRLESVGETSTSVARSDDLQHSCREGPCVEAATETHDVISPDLATDSRWPHWGPQAVDLGLRSVLSVTLHTGTNRRLGALILYTHETRHFTSHDIETARLFAAHATAALWAAIESDNLNAALQTRTQIGQATGILMERYGLDADQAAAVLRRYSQQTSTKLSALAEDVVIRRGLPAPDADPEPPEVGR